MIHREPDEIANLLIAALEEDQDRRAGAAERASQQAGGAQFEDVLQAGDQRRPAIHRLTLRPTALRPTALRLATPWSTTQRSTTQRRPDGQRCVRRPSGRPRRRPGRRPGRWPGGPACARPHVFAGVPAAGSAGRLPLPLPA